MKNGEVVAPSYSLTNEEANVIKDILKVIGHDDVMEKQFAVGIGMTLNDFTRLCDSAFEKLGNGRLTVISE